MAKELARPCLERCLRRAIARQEERKAYAEQAARAAEEAITNLREALASTGEES